jgi:hypothetical protein
MRIRLRNAFKIVSWFVAIVFLLSILGEVHVCSNQAEHERHLREKEADLIRKMSQPSGDSNRAEVTVQKQTTNVKAGGK